MKVHNILGPGFQEVIYQRCLAIVFNKSKIEHVREQDRIIYYDGIEVGTRRADFIVGNKILVELKALVELEGVNFIQGKNYLVAYNLALGLLINFGATRLEYKLLFHPNHNNQ